jgi:serine/threonine-protein kinase
MSPSRHPVDQLATTLDSQAISNLQNGDRDRVPTTSGTTPQVLNLRNVTVLPKVDGSGEEVELTPRSETRYQRVRHLGAGAMGEVTLVQDNDIGRTVAMKQLLTPTQSAAGVARFVEEIRTIGQLEHPNIVPIHDVGVDENGQLFFVMKHIDGETLESVLQKLAAGDPTYLARYTVDARIEIFLGLLRALQCAHEKGVIHRGEFPCFFRRENLKNDAPGTQ